MNIRIHNSGDLPTIVSFNISMAEETEGKVLDPDTIRSGVLALLEDPSKGFYVLAEENSEIIGQLMITKEWSDWRNGDFWWIQSVYVLPEYRTKGVYRNMHEYVAQMAKRDGNVCGMRLYVDKNNSAAKEVYKKMGMEDSHYVLFEEDWSK
ncbi:MAG: GNAT family N-acetyltransferase [Candidatus Marinimicrobia bacterium]|jgi:GNAT superfamily N-acetyltransferase|nr:GNAT family N-acetyltransferase [Candidatus Neomarinimicrobiota bacterium]|tara:strand:+ start:139 stop:591 length:453 start_codon:yes stop_codon:yes gene_type:complete